MDEGGFDRLARRVGTRPSRRWVMGRGLGALAAALGAVGPGGGLAKREKPPRPPGAGTCDPTPKLCASSDECCGGRVCAQNGCAIPDRPRCCAGVGQPCSGNSCECCGPDLDCVGRTCVYKPKK